MIAARTTLSATAAESRTLGVRRADKGAHLLLVRRSGGGAARLYPPVARTLWSAPGLVTPLNRGCRHARAGLVLWPEAEITGGGNGYDDDADWIGRPGGGSVGLAS